MSIFPLMLYCIAVAGVNWLAIDKHHSPGTSVLIVMTVATSLCAVFQVVNIAVNNGPGPFVLVAIVTQLLIGVLIGCIVIGLRRWL